MVAEIALQKMTVAEFREMEVDTIRLIPVVA